MEFPHAGQTFQAKYKLLEVLGRGGFAAVYKALDQEIGREVAIKMLMPSEGGYASSVVARFQREARIIAQLRDPHTITMFDYGRTDDGLLYMVFEYVAGADLAQRLESDGPVPSEVVAHVLDQTLHALREAHEAGVLHRDIKPANVLVYSYMDDEWRVKLLDFGIAKPGIGKDADPVATLTRAGGIIGTPRYMSPEQLCGEELGPTTDIYSLGLVAYEMLVGRPAIDGEEMRDNIRLQLSTEPLRLPRGVAMPPYLRTLIERMLARDPDDRFGSARAAINALRAGHQVASGSGPLSGPNRRITPTNPHPALTTTGLSHHSSSGEIVHPTPRSSTLTAPTDSASRDSTLSAPLLLGLGVLLGAAIVIPLTLIATHSDDDAEASVEINPSLTEAPSATNARRPTPSPTKQVDNAPTADTAPPDETASAERDDGCGTKHDSGTHRRTITRGLATRDFVTYVPKTYDPNRRHPVTVLFHDRTRTPHRVLQDTELMRFADRDGVLLVAPEGGDYTRPWAPESDVDYVMAVLEEVDATYCVDSQRRYGVAHNVGAAALEGFACLIPFSAIATTAFRGGGLFCDYSPPVPHIHLAGENDRYHPIDGGATCDARHVPSLEKKAELWYAENGCSGADQEYLEHAEGKCTTRECEAPFVVCLMKGGRDWPNAAPRDFQLPGCARKPTKFPISETVWRFLMENGQTLNPAEE